MEPRKDGSIQNFEEKNRTFSPGQDRANTEEDLDTREISHNVKEGEEDSDDDELTEDDFEVDEEEDEEEDGEVM